MRSTFQTNILLNEKLHVLVFINYLLFVCLFKCFFVFFSRHCHVAIRHPLQQCCSTMIRASCRRQKQAQRVSVVVESNAVLYRLFVHHPKRWNGRWVRLPELVSTWVLVPCSGSRHTPLLWQLTITRWCTFSITTMASLTTSIHQLRQAAVGACLSYLLVAGSITCTSLPELLLPGAVLDRFASAVFLFVFLVFFFFLPPPPWGPFAKLRKATVSFVMSVRMKQLCFHWRDFH